MIALICILTAPIYLGYHLWFQSLDPLSTINALNPVHLFISIMAVPVGFGVYFVRRWGYFSYLVFASGLVSYFLYEYFNSPVLHNYLLLLTTIALVGSVSLILQKHITAPYFNPRLKWWEHPPRYRVNLKSDFQIDGDTRGGSLLDLSLSGCYANIDTKLSAGDTIYVNLALLDFKVKTMAKVIWVNRDGGYGLMFVDLDRNDKKQLKSVINYLTLSLGESSQDFINTGVPKTSSRTPISI